MDFGYIDDHLTNSCNVIDILYDEIYHEKIDIIGNISICTWNIWGLKKYSNDFMEWSLKKRLDEFLSEIRINNIDIICLQEVSTEVYLYLKSKMSDYNFYENEINIEKTKHKRNRNLEILFLSKFPATRYINYSIGGNLGYNNQISVLEYGNLILYGIYLQAGSKYSIDQQNKAHFYTRCRIEQLIVLDELIKTYENNKYHCVLGDFNFHLDGDINDWKEIKYLDEIKVRFIDTYRFINDDNGYSEDTDINHMRYNSKFLDKMLRYDGILVSKNIKITNSFIIGTNEIFLNEKETQSMIESFIKDKDINKMKKNKYGLLSLWASDHFGITTIINLV